MTQSASRAVAMLRSPSQLLAGVSQRTSGCAPVHVVALANKWYCSRSHTGHRQLQSAPEFWHMHATSQRQLYDVQPISMFAGLLRITAPAPQAAQCSKKHCISSTGRKGVSTSWSGMLTRMHGKAALMHPRRYDSCSLHLAGAVYKSKLIS